VTGFINGVHGRDRDLTPPALIGSQADRLTSLLGSERHAATHGTVRAVNAVLMSAGQTNAGSPIPEGLAVQAGITPRRSVTENQRAARHECDFSCEQHHAATLTVSYQPRQFIQAFVAKRHVFRHHAARRLGLNLRAFRIKQSHQRSALLWPGLVRRFAPPLAEVQIKDTQPKVSASPRGLGFSLLRWKRTCAAWIVPINYLAIPNSRRGNSKK
jgi:hypothetical protein